MNISRSLVALVAVVPLASGFLVADPIGFRSPISRIDPQQGTTFQKVNALDQQSVGINRVPLFSAASTDDESPSLAFNSGYGALFALLVSFAILGPGDFGSSTDNALLEQILANPVKPGVNELYYTLFNAFTTMPVIAAMLILPQDRNKGLPASPFLLLAAGLGYFTMGPYLTTRSPPVESKTLQEMGWFTRTVLENKIFAWIIFGLTIFSLYAAGAAEAYQHDPAALWSGFVELMTTSKFCAVSGMDLTIIHIALTTLIPRDYALRNPEASPDEGIKIAAATFFLPYIGSSLYLALRPSLRNDI